MAAVRSSARQWRRRWLGPIGVVLLGLPGLTGAAPSDTPATAPPASLVTTSALPALIAFRQAGQWAQAPAPVHSGTAPRQVLLSPRIEASAPWNELIVSWNVQPADGSGLEIEVQALRATNETRFYSLGRWSLGTAAPLERASVPGQHDSNAVVRTDTLVLREPADGARLRVSLFGSLAGQPERLRLLTLSWLDSRASPAPRPALRSSWGRTLDVPERSQVAYADGRAWCSPTSVSMILGWWARDLARTNLDRTVPEVAEGVNDPAWPGTGNWPFNTAYAGSLPGLAACAVRLPDLRAVEELVAGGVPVVLSVNAPALRGKPVAPDGGHLVIALGFTPEGDVVANDPWARLGEGQRVRRVYPRTHVERAWDHARRLAYVILPESKLALLPAEWR